MVSRAPYLIFFMSGSTFLKPAGTSKTDALTESLLKLFITVVISRSDPGAPLPDAEPLCCCAGGASELVFLRPRPKRPPRAPPSALPTEGFSCCACCCCGGGGGGVEPSGAGCPEAPMVMNCSTGTPSSLDISL